MTYAEMEASFEYNRPWVYAAMMLVFVDEKTIGLWWVCVFAVKLLSNPRYLGLRKPVFLP